MSGRLLSKVGAKAVSDVCVLVLPVKRDGSTGLALPLTHPSGREVGA